MSLDVSFSSVANAPSSINLAMNGPHLARGRFETGDVNLDPERGNNFEGTLFYDDGNFFGQFTAFQNSISNYIYLQDELEHMDEDHHDEDHERIPRAPERRRGGDHEPRHRAPASLPRQFGEEHSFPADFADERAARRHTAVLETGGGRSWSTRRGVVKYFGRRGFLSQPAGGRRRVSFVDFRLADVVCL